MSGVIAPEPRHGRLTYDLDVSEASPVVRGTWVTVAHIVSCVVDGSSWDDILRMHPELDEADIRAALTFAIAEEELTAVPSGLRAMISPALALPTTFVERALLAMAARCARRERVTKLDAAVMMRAAWDEIRRLRKLNGESP